MLTNGPLEKLTGEIHSFRPNKNHSKRSKISKLQSKHLNKISPTFLNISSFKKSILLIKVTKKHNALKVFASAISKTGPRVHVAVTPTIILVLTDLIIAL